MAESQTEDATDGFTISCECGHENSATFRDDAKRAARNHEGQSGHIGQTTVKPVTTDGGSVQDDDDPQPPEITNPGNDVCADSDGECFVELTEHGLFDRRASYGREDVEEWHDVVHETDESLVLHTNGHAVREWADEFQLNVDYDELASWFLNVARGMFGREQNNGHDPYSGRQPIVFDKRTFDD